MDKIKRFFMKLFFGQNKLTASEEQEIIDKIFKKIRDTK